MSHAPHFAEFRNLAASPLDTIDSWSSLLGINRAGTGQFNPPYRPFDIERPFEFHECGYSVRENPYMLIWRRVPNQLGEELEPGAELWMQYIMYGGLRASIGHHLLFAVRSDVQLNDVGLGRERHHVHGLPGFPG